MEMNSLSDQSGSPEFGPFPETLKFLKMAKLGIYAPLGFVVVVVVAVVFFF